MSMLICFNHLQIIYTIKMAGLLTQLLVFLICTDVSVHSICCNSHGAALSKIVAENQGLLLKTIRNNQETLLKTIKDNQESIIKMVKNNQATLLEFVGKTLKDSKKCTTAPLTTTAPDTTTPPHLQLGSTNATAAKNCLEILKSGHSNGTGLYWIKPDGENYATQTLCDMTYNGGGWSLASYGYISSIGYTDKKNRNIPNMNNPNGYNWNPRNRQKSNGVIRLRHGATYLARQSSYMLMAGGGTPNNIDAAQYVYKINITSPYTLTFANHGIYKGSNKMHVKGYTIQALKGDTGSATRYALAESLGVTWSDSYPTGYGFSNSNAKYASYSKGPFFPSIHTGDGHGTCYCGCKRYEPDVASGNVCYNHEGWWTMNGSGKTGPMSIWFK